MTTAQSKIIIEEQLAGYTVEAIKELFDSSITTNDITVNLTRKDFEGDFTVVTFSLAKYTKKTPGQTAEELGRYLIEKYEVINRYNVVKGFLNLSFTNQFWLDILSQTIKDQDYGRLPAKNQTIVVEYCGPNTNKPLHLGHIRNMLLGYSVSEILQAGGYSVKKVNIYNDRGIAICKSMVAWLQAGNGGDPKSANKKGDHFVGDYYVMYGTIFDKEVAKLKAAGMSAEQAEKEAPIYKAAQEMLLKWEASDKQTLQLWSKMNEWVYEGFEETYQKLGVDFDKAYYESKTYLDGKAIVEEGLEKSVYYQREDGSIWVDLTDEGLDEKILIRSDGTAVYLTQDLGTAQERFNDYRMDRSIYVVANEQDYHFKVLKLALQKLGKAYADGIYHLSYGMVDLPEGKMKSREGTTVDADDLIKKMVETAAENTRELGKIEGLSDEEAESLFNTVGLGALKYFILKVNPKKRILFNPKESIDLHGNTGPFIQYTYARIQSLLRNSDPDLASTKFENEALVDIERELIIQLYLLPEIIKEAASNYDPSVIANYIYHVSKLFSKFYAEVSILKAENEADRTLRLAISEQVARHIKFSMKLLGIEVPERM